MPTRSAAFRGVLVAVLVLSGVGLARPARAEPGVDAAAVDRFVRSEVRRSGPGVAVAVVRDGAVLHTAAAGKADADRALTVDTPMRIESLSKSFTAAAVLQLVEQGRVELDRPAQHYLPEFAVADPRGAEITVRQLLTHTSGMTDATAPDLYADDARTLAEAVARLRTARLASAPGQEFAYHNPNYHVLARLVEVVSAETFGDFLRRHIFEPAGMTRTVDVATANEAVPGMAAGHLTAFGRPLPFDGPDYFVDGSGGVVTTPTDLGRWVGLQQNGGLAATGAAILSTASVQLMHTPQSPGGSDYGFGWYTAESAEGPPLRTSHSGAGSGFGAYQGLFTESGWGVAVLVNHGAGLTSSDPGVIGQNLLAALDPTIPPLEQRGAALPVDLVLAGLTAATVAWSILAVRRSSRWARQRLAGRRWLVPLRLLPPVLAISVLLAVPALQLFATQRTAPWSLLFTVAPVAVVWLWALGLGSAAVLFARVVRLVRLHRRSAPTRVPDPVPSA